MTDRELIELAAKAAGVEIYESTDGTIQNRSVWVFEAGGGMGTMPYEEQWNPLRDDAQALQLAVRLGIDVQQFVDNRMVEAWKHPHQACGEDYGADPYAATRRAIVRAAAEIAKQQEQPR